jgi:hypothetical protein
MEACVESDNAENDDNVVDRVLIASYNRKALKQTGSGHFSPIAAYDQESDSVLIMDTVCILLLHDSILNVVLKFLTSFGSLTM